MKVDYQKTTFTKPPMFHCIIVGLLADTFLGLLHALMYPC